MIDGWAQSAHHRERPLVRFWDPSVPTHTLGSSSPKTGVAGLLGRMRSSTPAGSPCESLDVIPTDASMRTGRAGPCSPVTACSDGTNPGS